MYCVGDWVSYPMHGAGMIEAIEERESHGQINQYYVLRFVMSGMKVMVPVKSIQDVGLRDVIAPEEYDKILKRLSSNADETDTSWNRRYRDNMDKLRSGSVYDVADVVRHLTLRDRKKGLSTGEKKMLNNAKQILISEMALVSKKTVEEINQSIEDAIQFDGLQEESEQTDTRE